MASAGMTGKISALCATARLSQMFPFPVSWNQFFADWAPSILVVACKGPVSNMGLGGWSGLGAA